MNEVRFKLDIVLKTGKEEVKIGSKIIKTKYPTQLQVTLSPYEDYLPEDISEQVLKKNMPLYKKLAKGDSTRLADSSQINNTAYPDTNKITTPF